MNVFDLALMIISSLLFAAVCTLVDMLRYERIKSAAWRRIALSLSASSAKRGQNITKEAEE